MGRTHILLGIDSLWLLDPWLSTSGSSELVALALIGAAFGSLLPDLDATSSLLQKVAIGGVYPFVLPARAINRRFGHRGFLHSFLAMGLLGAFTGYLIAVSPALWAGLLLGYLSHPLGDSCTKSGVRLLYPGRRVIHLMPRPLRLTTGSEAEEVVFAALGGLALLFLLGHLLPLGYP